MNEKITNATEADLYSKVWRELCLSGSTGLSPHDVKRIIKVTLDGVNGRFPASDYVDGKRKLGEPSRATEGGYLETRLRSFAVTRLHRDPKTGEVWTEPESQRDQDLLDAADEIERLRGLLDEIETIAANDVTGCAAMGSIIALCQSGVPNGE